MKTEEQLNNINNLYRMLAITVLTKCDLTFTKSERYSIIYGLCSCDEEEAVKFLLKNI